MEDYTDFLSKMFPDEVVQPLDEAGNVSSAFAMKKYNAVIKNGRRIVGSRSATESEKNIARMMVDVAGLSLLSVASSGSKSFLSSVAKLGSLRGL